MIAKQLKRDGVNDRRDAFVYPGQFDMDDAFTVIQFCALAGEVDQLAATGTDFLHIGL